MPDLKARMKWFPRMVAFIASILRDGLSHDKVKGMARHALFSKCTRMIRGFKVM